tara:strand:+ start:263 stop:784 length:522 start_codon:yes stop_codon:yes gene_type:complete
MKNKIFLISLLLFFSFCFVVLFKGLNNSNVYVPKKTTEKTLVNFVAKDFFTEKEIYFDEIFIDSEFYILNIWSSWCLPCIEEHPKLMQLSKNKSLKLIGLNYRDNKKNAKKFINKFGNPYSSILSDRDGTIAIEWGAYGVPETTIIDRNKKILKKFIGPLDDKSIKEINLIIK